jgi:hypothetical protein
MWCGEYRRRSVFCISVLCRFWKGEHPRKNHMVGRYLAKFDSFLYGVDSSQLSVFWRFAISFRLWLLCSLHSGQPMTISLVCYQLASNFIFSGIYKTTIGDIVLDGLLPSCFLVGCLWIVCWTLGIWWISSENCSPISLEVLVLRVPEIPFQNEGVLPVVAQGHWTIWRLVFYWLPLHEQDWTSLYAPNFWGTKHMSFFLKRLGCFWNSIASFH